MNTGIRNSVLSPQRPLPRNDHTANRNTPIRYVAADKRGTTG